MKEGNLYTAHTAYETAFSINKIWYDAKKKEPVQIRKVPLGWNVLWKDSIFLIIHISGDGVTRNRENRNDMLRRITITVYNIFPFLKKKDFFDKFINQTKIIYYKKVNTRQRVYKTSSHMNEFRPPILLNKMALQDEMFIITPAMKQVIDGMKHFMNSREDYEKKGFSYSRKICTYGPPGSGKSQLIVHIAGEFNMPLYYINHSNRWLEKYFDRVSNGIIVIEEIDKCIRYCHSDLGEDEIKSATDKIYNKGATSIKKWHNVLDNVVGDNVIIYFTTNNMHILKKINHLINYQTRKN